MIIIGLWWHPPLPMGQAIVGVLWPARPRSALIRLGWRLSHLGAALGAAPIGLFCARKVIQSPGQDRRQIGRVSCLWPEVGGDAE